MNGAVWDEALIWIHIVHPCEFTLSNHFAVFRLVRCKLFGFVVALEQYFVGSAFLFWEDWRHEIYVWRRKEAGREAATYRDWAVASTPPQTAQQEILRPSIQALPGTEMSGNPSGSLGGSSLKTHPWHPSQLYITAPTISSFPKQYNRRTFAKKNRRRKT